jgi:hypothetical protein
MMAVTYFNAVINRARGQKRAIERGGMIIEVTEVIEATEVIETTEVATGVIEAANLGMTEGVVIEGVLSS